MTKQELQDRLRLLEEIREFRKEIIGDSDVILSEDYALCMDLNCLYNEVQKVVLDFIYSNRTKHILKLIGNYLSKIALQFQHLQDSIFQSLTLLFGMCSSRPSYIYAAIYGSSSTRIFS